MPPTLRALASALALGALGACAATTTAATPARPTTASSELASTPDAPFDPRFPGRVRTVRVARSSGTHDWVWRGRYLVRSTVACTNGPVAIPVELPRVPFGVALEVHAWAYREEHLDAFVDVQAGGQTYALQRFRPPATPAQRVRDCAASPTQSLAVTTTPTAAPAPPRGAPATPGDVGATPEPDEARVVPIEPVSISDGLGAGSTFGTGWFAADPAARTTFVDPEFTFRRYVPVGDAYPTGDRAVVRIWFPVAQDLRDVVFEVTLIEVLPRVPVPQLVARLREATERTDAEQARRTAERRAYCADRLSDPTCWSQPGAPGPVRLATRPPPPPRVETRPRAPSATAEWIPGTWRWDGSAYAWMAGFWREPPPGAARASSAAAVAVAAPVAPARPAATRPASAPARAVTPVAPAAAAPARAAVVVTAPTAPVIPPVPPAPVEVPPPAPAADVEWIPGRWSWNGSAYVWIAGTWLQPPAPAARWRPPSVELNPTGVRIEIPGAWVLPR